MSKSSSNTKVPQTCTVDISRQLVDLDSVALNDAVVGSDGSPKFVAMTLGRVRARSLVENLAGDGPIDVLDKIKWFSLAQRLLGAKEVR